MEIVLNREVIKKLLILYYQKYENIDCNINIRASLEKVGWYEEEQCVVRICQIIENDLFGKVVKAKRELEEKEIKEALRIILLEKGYEMTGLTINNEIREKCSGYGMCEHYYNTPYFGGITIYTKELEKGRQYINQYKGGK